MSSHTHRSKKKKHAVRKRSYRSDSQANVWSKGIDWETWKEEFFTEFDDDGTFAYADIWELSKAKAKTPKQRVWIVKSIGIRAHKEVEYQGDWFSEREGQKNVYSKITQKLAQKVEQEMDVVSRAQDIASTYAPWNHRIEEMVSEIDKYMGGRIFTSRPKGMTTKQKFLFDRMQKSRFAFYVKGLSKVLDLKMKVDSSYLKAVGYDRPQLIAYIAAQMAKSNNPQIGAGEEQAQITDGGVRNVLAMAINNIVSKAKSYELDLPEELEHMRNITPVKPNGHSNGKDKSGGKKIEDDDSSEG